MSIKSSTCFSRKGKPLTEYYNESEAVESADFIKRTHRTDLIPYRCDKCGLWHLAPRDRQTPSVKCNSCMDSNGQRKELYFTRTDAERRAEILFKEQKVRLKVYECPVSEGWHLTKE